MPNITVQWYAGRTDQQKREITAAITEAMVQDRQDHRRPGPHRLPGRGEVELGRKRQAGQRRVSASAMLDLAGIIPATVLPMTADAQIDEPALRRYIRWIAGQGIKAVAVNVDTGRGPAPLARRAAPRPRHLPRGAGRARHPDRGRPRRLVHRPGREVREGLSRGRGRRLPRLPDHRVPGPAARPRGAVPRTTGPSRTRSGLPMVIFTLQPALGGIDFDDETLAPAHRDPPGGGDQGGALRRQALPRDRGRDALRASPHHHPHRQRQLHLGVLPPRRRGRAAGGLRGDHRAPTSTCTRRPCGATGRRRGSGAIASSAWWTRSSRRRSATTGPAPRKCW